MNEPSEGSKFSHFSIVALGSFLVVFIIIALGVLMNPSAFLTLISEPRPTPVSSNTAVNGKYILPQSKLISDLISSESRPARPWPTTPNLQVKAIKTSPRKLIAGRWLSLSGVVKNFGSNFRDSVVGRARIDIGNNGTWDLVLKDKTVRGFHKRQSHVFHWPRAWKMQAGTAKLEFCVALKNGTVGTSTGNNCLSQVITINAKRL